jgi:hypothetical protein
MPKRKEKAQIATASQNGYENDGRWAWRADPKSDMDLSAYPKSKQWNAFL